MPLVVNVSTVIFSSAFNVIAPLPALITEPSAIVKAPPMPASAITSASALIDTAPLALVISEPVPVNITSLSAVRVIAPLALVIV